MKTKNDKLSEMEELNKIAGAEGDLTIGEAKYQAKAILKALRKVVYKRGLEDGKAIELDHISDLVLALSIIAHWHNQNLEAGHGDMGSIEQVAELGKGIKGLEGGGND